MTAYPTTFFGWVGLLLDNYGPLLLRGTWVTMVIALSGTVIGFIIGLLSGLIVLYEGAILRVISHEILHHAVSAEHEEVVHEAVKEMAVVGNYYK